MTAPISTGPVNQWVKTLMALALLGATSAFAQAECKPSPPENTRVIDAGPVKTVVGPLADFDPCHRSVRLDTPTLFAKKRGDKPPVVIIAHGGSGLSGYERDFAKLMNHNGYATLVFDAFEMNGLASGSDLVQFQISNAGRQRMIYKATLGAYRWILKSDKVDTSRMFVQGMSNGASVSINMAAAVDPAFVKGVIAEAGPAAGIGFPDAIQVPLLMIYGAADNYGGLHANDYMHLRGMPCSYNEHDGLAPPGFAARCSKQANPANTMPAPAAWYQTIRDGGADVRFELVEGAGHGMLFSDFSSFHRTVAGGRTLYQSHGANAAARRRIQATILEFLQSRL